MFKILLSVIRAMFNNPLRKGLADDYTKYKYLGSFEFNILHTRC